MLTILLNEVLKIVTKQNELAGESVILRITTL